MRRIWLNQQQMHILFRDRTMLNAFRYNVHLPRPKGDRSISKLNVEHALQDEKKVIGVVCAKQIRFHFHCHDIVIVEPRLNFGVHALACDSNSRLGWTPSTCPMNGGWIE